ncbi:DUF262 domain-containing protein [Bradyrhizobium erythrophlei]|uniref:GmrSD restriction endonucleases N-terminal domain-containing protein n=1 Tax=Bradyrhizobium erythrophlei TaxID=1437360 RepID=A0A1M5RN80_9BRAD|nr:DUF262 domain-containing protein [Bradyrhizobium erythrophlei]SHH27725.1 Protein of unknown function DUF262 [Bradyrhizobium erythrophlei]
MDYRNSEMKLDQLIGYFNEKKINLIPPFQRGHVWKLPARQELMKNMIAGRPIPAIFLYKEARGSRYTYNILDGKQRLESLLLFVGNARDDMKVDGVWSYFSDRRVRNTVSFPILYEGTEKRFAELTPDVVRNFREYAIPTIEITLDDETSLDEIINLFVDINQHGVKVNRFDIVKAIGKENKLLRSALLLIAIEQKRGEDVFYKKRRSAFTRVLGHLSFIANLEFGNQVVDRMWERLLEIVLFCRTREHREPRSVLKRFITSKDGQEEEGDKDKSISRGEMKTLQKCFGFLAECYKTSDLGDTMLATDQPHFYTMITSLIVSDLLEDSSSDSLLQKLLRLAAYLPDRAQLPADRKLAVAVREYKKAAARGTAQTGQREIRQRRFIELVKAL